MVRGGSAFHSTGACESTEIAKQTNGRAHGQPGERELRRNAGQERQERLGVGDLHSHRKVSVSS